MRYSEVKAWVRDKYPHIKILDSYENTQDDYIYACKDVTVNFSKFINIGHGSAISNTDTDEKAIVLCSSGDEGIDINILLHEVGHLTTHQCDKKNINNIYYNEINAWLKCASLCKRIGVYYNIEYAKVCFMTYVEEHGMNNYCNALMYKAGFTSDKPTVTKYKPANVGSVWGSEKWRTA